MAEPRNLFYYPRNPSAWLQRTAAISPLARAAWADLEGQAWDAPKRGAVPCSLPDDDATLARMARLELREWRKVSAEVRGLLMYRDGVLVDDVLLKVWNEQQVAYTKRATAGRTGGNAKAKAQQSSSHATALLQQSELELDGELEAPLTGQLLASPPAGDAPAPEGAALPAATGGDYQATPGAQAALAKLGHRPDPDVPRAPVPTLRELEAQREQQLERDRVHYVEVIESARAWKKDHPEQMPTIRCEQRALLDLEEGDDVPPGKRRALTEGILGAISFANQWPSPDVWDGSPMYRSPAEATA